MRKTLGIGIVSFLLIAAVGGGAYWLFSKTPTARQDPDVQAVRVENRRDEGNAEPSDEIEPLVVQGRQHQAVPKDAEDEFGGELARVVLEPGAQQPPRPGEVARMPMADETPGVGVWLYFDWSTIQAALSRLNIFEIKREEAVPEPEHKEANPPPSEPPLDHHSQIPHCPYMGPCPVPYRSMPRD